MAKRICGSLDLYGDSSRHPHHSINFITCHDGFPLNDLVSYNRKHNWANGENDRDGCLDNLSYNCDHEGPTDDPRVNALRQRQMRNFLTLLLISQGVPFLSHGDEFARTQHGNNNAYCQDNEISWVDWDLAQKNAGLLGFTRMMIALRQRFFAISREEFVCRMTWHGTRLGDPDWTGKSRTLAFQMHGWHGLPDLHVMLNAHWESQRFALPPHRGQWRWSAWSIPSCPRRKTSPRRRTPCRSGRRITTTCRRGRLSSSSPREGPPKGEKRCHSVRQARERRKRLKLGSLSCNSAG